MTPKRLLLTNFLSYSSAQLDFAGLHVACICGPNGAGKSSLLEAMAWAIWGQGRGSCDDDIIHLGAQEAQVDFVFEHRQQVYRILRTRRRRQQSRLDFQIDTGDGFRSLTQRGMRATQQLILQQLQVDYDTFIHSAYLRQGQADEFMLKRPAERKQILADLLKLSHYDELATRAKEQARDRKTLTQVTHQSLQHLSGQLAQRGAVQTQYHQLQAQLQQCQTHLQACQRQRDRKQQQQQQRQRQQHQRQTLQQQLDWLHQQRQQQQQQQQRLQQQQQHVVQILADRANILAQFNQYQQLEQQLQQADDQAQTFQALQVQLAELGQTQSHTLAPLVDQQRQHRHQLDTLLAQRQDVQHTLEARPDIEAALAQLTTAKAQLAHLDRCQLARTPLLQQQQQLQIQRQQTTAKLTARLEALSQTQAQLTQQQQQQPHLQQAVAELSHQIDYLEQRRLYQEQLRLKGQERRSFMEKLQAEQRILEAELGHLSQKLLLFKDPAAPCPVCDRPLQTHAAALEHTYQQQYDDVQNRIWVIREQLAVSEREIQVLRQEYRDLETELAPYAATLEQRGQLQAQLQAQAQAVDQLTHLETERQQLERCLQGENRPSPDLALQEEIQTLEAQLTQLNYDDRDHALVRNQVEKLRWAEIRQAELVRADRRLRQLAQHIPQQQAQLAQLTAEIEAMEQSFEQQQAALTDQRQQLNYCPDTHQRLRQQCQATAPILARHQALQQAAQQAATLTQQLDAQQSALATTAQAIQRVTDQLHPLIEQLDQWPDQATAIATLDAQIHTHQTQREAQLAQVGRLEQQLAQFDAQQEQLQQLQQQHQQHQHQQQVYQSLAQAFGKNGLQALLIENLLPQLEAETNHLLGRLSNHQLHVQFVTQRAGRSRNKLIDTLDIVIADAHGTRPYETYSGGEAFRVNFAIRLALARLLAQRSGMALQMLIIDEGFGSQDEAGCDRLVSAINAIAPDFSCILTVTHRPYFREAFQTRIDVSKTDQGSQLTLSS